MHRLNREALAGQLRISCGTARDSARPHPRSAPKLRRLQQETDELRLRNAALAQDLVRHKASRGGSGGDGGGGGPDPEAAAKAELRCSRLLLENDGLRREARASARIRLRGARIVSVFLHASVDVNGGSPRGDCHVMVSVDFATGCEIAERAPARLCCRWKRSRRSLHGKPQR